MLAGVISLTCVDVAFTQSNLQVPVQFDFLDPGARSLAMGSAFSPLADDATAAVNNPAGLVKLSRREISVELRGKRVATTFLQGGRLSGNLTNRGIDVIPGPAYGETIEAQVYPSFASFVYPAGRFAVAAYSHQFVKTDQKFERTGVLGLFTTPTGVIQDAREPPQRVIREVRIASHGFAVGVRVNERLSVGTAVAANAFTFNEQSTRFATEGFDIVSLDPVHPSVYGAPDFTRGAIGGFSSRREVLSPRITGSDVRMSFTGGALYQLYPAITVGGMFRHDPGFDFKLTLPDNTRMSGVFDTPDSYTFGVSIRPSVGLTIVLDYSRVQYASLEDGFVDLIVGPQSEPNQFTVRNGNEYHVGMEYILRRLGGTPAIRLGGWYDPAHGVEFERSSTLNPFFNDLFSAALDGGVDLLHYTAGFGMTLTGYLELNAAADFAKGNTLFSTSVIVRF